MNVISNLLTKFFDPLKNDIVCELIRGVSQIRYVTVGGWPEVIVADCYKAGRRSKKVKRNIT